MIKRLLFLFFLFVSFLSHSAIIYVKNGGTGNGTSWVLAYGNLQTALLNANVGDEIWVKQGTYTPSATQNINDSFVFKDGVKIYGGFDGTEISLDSRADTTGATTILSGDLGNNLKSKIIFKVSNATNPENLIDGFTIKDAYNILSDYENCGAAFYIFQSTIKIQNSTIKDNFSQATDYSTNEYSTAGGSAINSWASNVSLYNVDVLDNTFKNIRTPNAYQGFGVGGAFCIINGTFTYEKGKLLNNKVLTEGYTSRGGGGYFFNLTNLVLNSLLIKENAVIGVHPHFGAPSEGGAFYIYSVPSVLIDNSLFHANYTSYVDTDSDYQVPSLGNGLAYTLISSVMTMKNTTVGYNLPSNEMTTNNANTVQAIVHTSSTTNYYNSVFLQAMHFLGGYNPTTFHHCVNIFGPMEDIEGYFGGHKMEFVNPFEGDYTPLYCSRYLNRSDSAHLTSTVDLNGNSRIVGSGADPGAIEFQNPGDYNRVYVNATSEAIDNEGISWDTAYKTLQEALNCKCIDSEGEEVRPEEIWVAQGIYKAGPERESTFRLNNGQKIYGGLRFGDDTLDGRDLTLEVRQTILTGEYEGGVHVRNVVTATDTYIDTEINGLIIEGGLSDPNGSLTELGGSGIMLLAQLTINNCWIRNNNAIGNVTINNNSQMNAGAGMLIFSNQYNTIRHVGVHVENTKFTNNRAGDMGGALYYQYYQNFGAGPNAIIEPNPFASIFKNVKFSENVSLRTDNSPELHSNSPNVCVDGAVTIHFEDFEFSNGLSLGGERFSVKGGLVTLKRGFFKDYTFYQANNDFTPALNNRGLMGFGGTGYVESVVAEGDVSFGGYEANVEIVNSTFVKTNTTPIVELANLQYSNFRIKNSIIDIPEGVYLPYVSNNSSFIVENSLFTNSLPNVMTDGGNNLFNTDPLFVDKLNKNFNLLPNSPAINTGNNTFLNLSPELDAVGNPRVSSEIVDLGALEYQGTVSVNDFSKNSNLQLYPNPAENEVFLQFDKYQKGSLAIYDLTGKQVLNLSQVEVQENEPFRINIENFASGTYIINWKGTDFNTSIKLIKK